MGAKTPLYSRRYLMWHWCPWVIRVFYIYSINIFADSLLGVITLLMLTLNFEFINFNDAIKELHGVKAIKLHWWGRVLGWFLGTLILGGLALHGMMNIDLKIDNKIIWNSDMIVIILFCSICLSTIILGGWKYFIALKQFQQQLSHE